MSQIKATIRYYYKKWTNKNNNSKSPGGDDVVSEHITTPTETLVCRIIDSDFWYWHSSKGLAIPEIVKQVYKGKGNKSQPENYRPITQFGC